jgi:predicted component of type VI protein secretion system
VARLNRGQDAGRTTIHHGALQVADNDGKVTHKLGQKGLDPVAGPVPPRPAAPALTAGQAQIIVATDGDDEHGESAPDDWAKTRVYATTQPPLEALPGNSKGTIADVDGETTIGVHAGVWHVGVVWVTESGQESELSETVTVEVEAPVDDQDIQDTLDAAEQIINDAVAAAQQQIDTLKDRLDNFEEFDPSELEQQLADVSQGLVDARQEAADLFESLEGEVTPQALISKLVAQEAWIGGTLLQDGAVEAEHVTASESLSAKIAEFLKLSVVDLVAGTGKIDDAVIQQLWVDGLVGMSATLARAIIAAPNLLADGDLRDGQGWWPAQLTLISDDTPPGYKRALRTNPGQGTLNLTNISPSIPVESGQDYMFEMWIKADKPGSVFFWDMRDQDGSMIGVGGRGGPTPIEPEGHDPGTRPVSNFEVPTTWTRIKTQLHVGDDVEHANMSSMYFNHPNGTERQAVITFGGVKITNMTDGSLIVDDSIHTRHLHVTEDMVGRFAEFMEVSTDMLTANAVTADKIAAGAIETGHLSGRIIKGEHIQGDTFTGQTFNGGTFTGSTFQTDSLPSRGLKFDADGIHGWDDNGQKTLQVTGELAEDMTDPDTGNFLTGRFYTNGAGKPGIVLNPDYGPNSSQGPGVWFSETGWVDSDQPAIWVDKSDDQFGDAQYNLVIRGKRWPNGNRSRIVVQGGLEASDGGGILVSGPNGMYGMYSDGSFTPRTIDGWGALGAWGFGRNGLMTANGAIINYNTNFMGPMYYQGHGTTGSSSNMYINANSGLIARSTSARKYKTDIQSTSVPDELLDLNLSTWLDKNEQAELKQLREFIGPLTESDTRRLDELQQEQRKIGLIADDVAEIDSRFVSYLDGEVDGLAYDRLGVAWIPLVRKQRETIKSQEARINDLEERLARLEANMP